MTETRPQATPNETESRRQASGQLIILLAVIAVFAAIMLIKVLAAPDTAPTTPGAVASLTSTRNDAAADYESALAAGKPVYVLFHSLTCQPCVEISAVADKVIPEYQDRVTFVNAITDDPAGQQLAGKFTFQYIPHSFFLAADGTVVSDFEGAMDEAQMRTYLDTLVAQ